MSNEKTKPAQSNTPVAQKPELASPSANVGLSEEQFGRIQRTLAYGLAIAGLLANGKQPTPSIRNLAEVKAYADVILEMVNAG